MPPYIVCTSSDLNELVKEVIANMELGYVPTGGISQITVMVVNRVRLDNRPQQATMFSQAMAKPSGILSKLTK